MRDYNRQEVRPPLDSYEPSWLALWMAHVRRAMIHSGGEPDAAREMHGWVVEHGAFVDIVARKHWIPVCPWFQGKDPESVRLNQIGRVMRDDVLVGPQSLFQLFLTDLTIFTPRRNFSIRVDQSCSKMVSLQNMSMTLQTAHEKSCWKHGYPDTLQSILYMHAKDIHKRYPALLEE